MTYGVRYEVYPAAYRDHTGVSVVDSNLPQSSNVEVGGINGNPKNSGRKHGYGLLLAPHRLSLIVSNKKTVIRTGGRLTSDPDSMRYLRDAYPLDLAPKYAAPEREPSPWIRRMAMRP